MNYEVRQLGKDTWMIRSMMVQMFLIAGTEKAMLIDTGAGMGDLKAQVEKLTDKPLIVVNTHGHVDHAGGNFQFKEVWMHADDFSAADWMCTLSERQEYVRSRLAVFAPEQTQEAVDSLQPCADYEKKALTEGQVFDLGDRELEVIFTPGHTHGSVCFLDRRYRRIFTGDTVNYGMLLQKSYECTALSVYVESLKKLLARGGEFDTVLRCHGEPVGTKGDIQIVMGMVQRIISGEVSGEHFVNPMRDCWNYNFGQKYSVSYDGPDAEL